MKLFIKNNYFIKFLISTVILFILLFISRMFLVTEEDSFNYYQKEVTKSNIYLEKETFVINVNYPKFQDKQINSIITNWLYEYIKEFRELATEGNNRLSIDYSLYYVEQYVNIFFEIDNSINNNENSKNLLIDLKDKKITQITYLYEEELLKEKIEDTKFKYPSFLSEIILQKNINDFSYFINEEKYIIYFNNLETNKNISYVPSIEVKLNEKSNEIKEIDPNTKMVALTFDDGPSEYSLEILKCLELNDAKATFFQLGSKMKSKKEITKELYDKGMEIGNHSYSHKYLTRLSLSEALNEINSTSIVFNEITGENLKLLRVPYGSLDSKLKKNSPFPFISWSIDTKDWLYRDAKVSAPIVLDYVEDGDIVLMHDVHFATIELVRQVVPELKARGYQLVTISQLAEFKNYKLEPGIVVKEIK